MAALNFDATNVPQQQAFEPLPTGDYPMHITASELKPTKAGDGHYLSLTLEVLNGAFQGRKVFDNLNLHNPNPTASQIAQQTLSAICHATGVIQVQDSAQLHNRPMLVKVAVKNDPQYGPGNKIKGYSAYTGAAPMPGGAPVPSAPAAPPMYQPAPAYQPAQAMPVAAPAQPVPPPMASAPTPPWAAQAPVAPAAPPAPPPVQQPSAALPPWAQQG